MIDKNKRIYFNLPTPVARLSFPALKEKTHVILNGQIASKKEAYRATFLISKKLEGDELKRFNDMREAVLLIAQKAWPLTEHAKESGLSWAYPSEFKSPFIDGDVTKEGKEINEAAKGHWVVRCASQKEIVVLNGIGAPPIQTLTGEGIDALYGGCFVRAELSPYPYEFGSNIGVSFGFTQVIKYAEGEPLGDRVRSPQEAFGGMLPPQPLGEEGALTDGLV